ncbi:MAG: AAA family ATPase [Dehalococcoidia bacterium]|nr:AAA family ATPase [Dehalococcoidia bacterium]
MGLTVQGIPVTDNELAAECGLPPSGSTGHPDFSGRRATLERLAKLFEDSGIRAGIDELRATPRGGGLTSHLENLGAHIRESAGSAAAFKRAPSFSYAVQYPRPDWWLALTAEVIDEMLSEIGNAPDADQLAIFCVNPENRLPARGEPHIVRTAPDLEAKHPNGMFRSLQLSRRAGRSSSTVLQSPGACQSPWTYCDTSPPAHDSPVTYVVEDPQALPASVSVIVLAGYGPGAFVTCSGSGTLKVTRPRRSRSSAIWQQQLVFCTGGAKVLKVFCGPTVNRVRVAALQIDSLVTDVVSELQVEVDEDTSVIVELVDSANQVISTIEVSIVVEQDERETTPSHFDALVRAHQEIRKEPPPARAQDCWLRRAEKEALSHGDSWRPVLASPGWDESMPRLASSVSRVLGSIVPQVDPRPRFDAPADFLAARQRIVDWLLAAAVPLPEIALIGEDMRTLAADYLRTYREWFERAPAEACWVDAIAVLEKETGSYGDQAFAAHEPVAVLLSPLHPVRLAWQVAAHCMLNASLEVPCPLAGLLDAHRSPDVLPIALTRGGSQPRWKSYIAIPCKDALWGLFWDAIRIRDLQSHDCLVGLASAGAVPRGIHSGFTASQAQRTLEEMVRVLPTRAILRVGIVSSGQGSTSCTDGLMHWCRERYGAETESLTGPSAFEVFDARSRSCQPLREEISGLTDDTGHRVRWFVSGTGVGKDLAIVDHLGLASPVNEVEAWRSPATVGNLVRSRVRLDRDNAEWVVESRVGIAVRSEDSLLDELGAAIAALENTASDLGGCSHIAFTPNRGVIASELRETRFLAVSSAEIDPACFARGTPQAGGFLWDYELPQALSSGEQRSGFYLLAKPPDAIKRTVLSAMKLVTETSVDLDELLVETSRRGIPILKRLSAGGSLARGELGMLLAVRLLQDAFRGAGRRVRLPVLEDGSVRMILPVDPYLAPLDKLRKALPDLPHSTRPDLLIACIKTEPNSEMLVYLVPVEVKFREGIMSAQERVTSLAQASDLGSLLHDLFRPTPANELWRICGRGFLAEILDHAFRVYGDPLVSGKPVEDWVETHQACLAGVLDGTARIGVAREGRLLVFDESVDSHVEDVDEDGFGETLVVSRKDARALVEDGIGLSVVAEQVVPLLDICGPAGLPAATETGGAIRPRELPAEVDSAKKGTASEASSGGDVVSPSQVPAPTVPPAIRERVMQGFAGFVGNQASVDTLKRGILRALLSTPPELVASYLFTGNPSTGKTELARRVARCLDLPFVSLDGRGLVTRERLFELVDGALRDAGQQATRAGQQYQKPVLVYPPLVIFIDEIHLVPRPIQESLLTALEPKVRSLLLSDRVAHLPRATFLFATTRPSEVDMAFRTRCTEIPLQDYMEDEVATIVGLAHPEWPDLLLHKVARLGRCVPRIALELAKELETEALVSEHQGRSLDEHLEEVRRTRMIDSNGLGLSDIEYLKLLEREARPLGERNILTMLSNIDKDRFLEEVEPLLVARLKLVRRTERGREITTEGRKYLIDARRQQAGST